MVARFPARRSLFFACLFAFLASTAATADAVADTWARVYRRVPGIEQRYQVMQNIVALDNPEMIPLLTDALEELLGVREQRSRTEEALWESLVGLIVGELGELRAREAAPLLLRVVDETTAPVLRANALVAIGYAGAADCADEIALLLRNLTLYRKGRAEGEETLVYGAIVALEKLHEDVGYAPVFAAYRAGYSRRIERLAEGALARMVPDPTSTLEGIVRDEADLATKLAALEQGRRSDAPTGSKAVLAAVALEQGLIRPAGSKTEAAAMRELRVEALEVIEAAASAGATIPPSVVGLATSVLGLETDVNERLLSIATLKSVGGNEVAASLLAYLGGWNDRQESGRSASAEEIRLVTSTIQSLGALKAGSALPELVRTQSIETWSAALIREAKAAAKDIGAGG